MKKKGQESGSGAAALVALIALFVLLYIVFLPPKERADLLDDTVSPLSGRNNQTTSGGSGSILLLENPGTVLPPDRNVFIVPVAPAELSLKTTSLELERVNSVAVSRSLLRTLEQNVTLRINDVDLVENAVLVFNIVEQEGVVTILLNGEVLYAKESKAGTQERITLPKKFLRNDNTLSFHAQKVGAAFWSTNTVLLSDVVALADVTDTSKSIAESTFYISGQDIDRLRSSRFFFLPTCGKDRGKLTITINGEIIYAAKPVCDTIAGIEFDPKTILLEGNNKVRFRTDGGSYSLSRARISSEPKEPEEYIYYFKIAPRLFDDVIEQRASIVASIKFRNDQQIKEGTLRINGYRRGFKVKEAGYAVDISDFIEDGFNSLEIVPEDPLQIVELRVEIE